MNNNELHFFNLLKKDIECIFSEKNAISYPMKEWKGNDIVAFQEDLLDTVKAKISEKWFYTYFKKEATTLPRIDILNFLSIYVGFSDWNDYLFSNQQNKKVRDREKYYIFGSAIFSVVVVFFYLSTNIKSNNFQFCFVDSIKNEEIKTNLNIIILRKRESPIYIKTDSLGCFHFDSRDETIKFIVQSPFYKTDTIVRHIQTNVNTTINLQTDDYALMLQYYTSGNIKDWKKRKEQLSMLIDDDAQIYQLFNQSMVIELYSKKDFIRKLTTPTSGLKNLEILDKTFVNGKIVKLKFRIK